MTKYTKIVANHIPKCGGSSLRHMLYQACVINNNFNLHPMYIPLCTHGNICLQENVAFSQIIHHNTRVFFDHSYSYFFEDTFNLKINETYRILSIRNPIKRLVSHMLFFDKIHPNSCSYQVLKNKINQYGHSTINYLTLHRYKEHNLDIETKYNIAKHELKKYNFIFQIENFQDSIHQFNIENPFSLHLEEKHVNISSGTVEPLSKKVLNNIKELISFEILLLKDFYSDINEDIN